MFRAGCKVLTTMCLLVLLAAVALWIRGYWVSDGVMYDDGKGSCVSAASYAGGLHVELAKQPSFPATHRIVFAPLRTGEVSGDVCAAPGPRPAWRYFHNKTRASNWHSRYQYTNFEKERGWAGFVVAEEQDLLNNIGMAQEGIRVTFSFSGTSASPLVYDGTDFPIPCIFKRIVVIPWWFVVTLLSILPALQIKPILRRRRRAMRLRQNLCVHCGYDLRATPWRCPECGAVPELAMKSDDRR